MRLLAPCALALAGCYAEMWGGVYPVSRSTSTQPGQAAISDRSASYSIGVSVGLWLDHYGVGVGIASNHVSPEAVVSQVDGARKQSTVRADQVRVDVDLPLRWWNPWFFPRATMAYGDVASVDRCLTTEASCPDRVDHPATGRTVFLGLTATFLSRSFAASVGPSYVGFAHAATGAPGALPAVDYASWGAQVRLLLKFSFGLEAFQFYTPSVIRPLPSNPINRCKPFSTSKDCWP